MDQLNYNFKVGNSTFKLGSRTFIMGILNVTPDSFSDGGSFYDFESAIGHAHDMVEQGADIIDVGGESTRPSSGHTSAEEERKRVIPVLKKLLNELDVPISIDTYKPEIAKEALDLGVHMVNDVNAFREEGMAELAAKYDVPCVLMHFAGGPHNMVPEPEYNDLMAEINSFLAERIEAVTSAGVAREKIIVDPGVGFSKNLKHNIDILRRLGDMRKLGQPVLIGTSRKSFIGDLLERPPEQRLCGTLASLTVSIMQGVDFVRVHDVQETRDVVKLTDAVVRN